MLSRPMRATLVSLVVGAVLVATGAFIVHGVEQGAPSDRSPASHRLADVTAADTAMPTVARLDQRDNTVERAAQHRVTLLAILASILVGALVLRPTWWDAERQETSRPASVSPFAGRAPPLADLRA